MIVFALLIASAFGLPSGSPQCFKQMCTGMCSTSADPLNAQSIQMTLPNDNTALTQYFPGEIYKIRHLTGANSLKGILVQVVDSTDEPVGCVTQVSDTSKFQSGPCINTMGDASVTHLNGNTYSGDVEFIWKAPAAAAGTLTIKSIVVETRPSADACLWGNKELTLTASATSLKPNGYSETPAPAATCIGAADEGSSSNAPSTMPSIMSVVSVFLLCVLLSTMLLA